MAQITSFEKITKERARIHDVVDCTYCFLDADDGERYFVLETYGSKSREMPDKVSQSIQLGKEAAAQLISILRKTFPGVR